MYNLSKIFLFLSFFTFSIVSCQFKIDGIIKDYNNKPIVIKTFSGSEDVVLTRITTDDKGFFSYKPSLEINGVISLEFNDNSRALIFSDNKDISFEAIKSKKEYNLTFSKSDINKAYVELNKYNLLKSLSESTYNKLLEIYSTEDEFFLPLQKEMERIKEQKAPNLDKYPILKDYESTLGLLNSDDSTKVLNKLVYGSEFLEKNGLLMPLVSNYISLNVKDIKTKEELEPKLEKVSQDLLDKVGVETNRGQHVLTGILKIFKSNGFNKLYDKLLEKANGLTCEINDELKNTLSATNNIKIGKKAPDFSFNGKVPGIKSLYSVNSKRKLLMFWASWCPHCTNEMSFVREFYNDFKKSGGEIISISADISESDYLSALKKYDMNWINYSDFLRWDSPIFKQYNISSTPTFILLGSDNKIELIAGKITEVRNYIDEN